ncbi:MAG: hydantoinase B/oxoprolinase family protein [Rhizobiales bacterium]|nr:hydantoinase B/oxoprolinase family protein [Hyphomicrobiales bacterium]
MSVTAEKPAFDGVRLALLNNRLEGIVRKMANTLLRTGRSGVLNTARDFSCCIVTAGNELLAAAESLPIHVLSGPDIMARSMQEFHPELRRGDAFLHNSPYHGCSHPADHTLLIPVIDENGTHRFTVQAKAHQADIGNSIPTTYHGRARDVYEEGALIFPAVQVQRDYRDIEDIVRMCRMRIRVPDQWWGDYLAMMGAARIGERELLALAGELGWQELEDHARDWLDYSESCMADALSKLPAGTAERQSTHDALPDMPPEGITITAKVKIDSAARIAEIDLRDNPDAQPCGLNLSEACSRTAAMLGVFNSIDHTVPKNAGSMRRIRIQLRENCVAGIPIHPTSCSAATTNIADRVANAVQAAFAEIADGAGMAECGASTAPAAGVISGIDPRLGRPFVNQVFLGRTCGAAAPTADAWQTICHVGNAGMCYLDSVELDELRFPLHVKARGFVPDTEGAGRTCGARVGFAIFGPRNCELDVIYNSDGHLNGPKGVRGGHDGTSSRQHVLSRNGDEKAAPQFGRVTLGDGEYLCSYSCGGGGYGPPHERDVRAVLHDIQSSVVSRERARDIYGVVVDENGALDQTATDKRRADMAGEE